ncbi:hypothetical protein C8A01DRAFT_46211 [Parachaetomium inaequale]|uniref:FAD dependent oxidoreductase domain-containing protein n=1 Tax=Parachaetomium inaequale TaxID=2588326 RepID=A0AAN6PGC7_9PEZI|nr:hypothetical protein C8A01DRAFT_46211 [Parachaetomium inaequale]
MSSCNIPTRTSYLVVGAGVFGASAALALARSRPSESIILVDKSLPPRQSASWDCAKVVRADYTDILYARLALEAKNRWRADPLYNRPGLANESSGWVEANRALAAVVNAAAAAGVRLVQANVSALIFDENRVCTGVRYADGQSQLAEHTLLATGAETAQLLVCSDPAFRELHAGNRLTAAGLVTGIAKLKPEEAARFHGAPVFLHAGGSAKVIPPNDMGELKITCDVSFTNTTEVLPGFILSSPPTDPSEDQASLALGMESELARVRHGILGGRSDHAQPKHCYICWDAITPNQNFIISPHPHAENLYLATGGSFHSFKFLPTIGDFIARMIDGSLEKELAERWAWDFVKEEGSNKRMMPARDMAESKA